MKHGIIRTGIALVLTCLAVLTWLFSKNLGLRAPWGGVLSGALFALGLALSVQNQILFTVATRTEIPNDSESYYPRLWGRFLKEAAPWARDNIGWGALFLVVPPAVIFFRDPHVHIDWTLIVVTLRLYGLALLFYVSAQLFRMAKKLDEDRVNGEASLRTEIAARDAMIQELKVALEKPRYSVAEQHDYEIAKKALRTLGSKGLIALRHIRRCGSLTFNNYDPVLPPGLNRNETLWVFNHCASEGVLTCHGTYEKTYAIAPIMEKVLDKLLYEENATDGV